MSQVPVLPERFDLSASEKQSPLWHRLMGHFEDRIARLQVDLEGDKGIDETNRLRGQIKALRALKALNKEPVVAPD